MRAMPPSTPSPMSHHGMYRENNAQAEGEQSKETPRDLNDMMRAMHVGETVRVDEIVAGLRKSGLEDQSMLEFLAVQFMNQATIHTNGTNGSSSSSDSKENEPKMPPAATCSGTSAAAASTAAAHPHPPQNQSSIPFNQEATPTANHATPRIFASRQTPSASERGRQQHRRERSRDSNPIGSFLRRSPTPERNSDPRKARSQSPLRRFLSFNGKSDVLPRNKPRSGSIPPPQERSGLPPPSPARPPATETPPIKTAASYPSPPPSTAGNTFCSPTPSQTPWAPPGTTSTMPPMSQPDFNVVGSQQTVHTVPQQPGWSGAQQQQQQQPSVAPSTATAGASQPPSIPTAPQPGAQQQPNVAPSTANAGGSQPQSMSTMPRQPGWSGAQQQQPNVAPSTASVGGSPPPNQPAMPQQPGWNCTQQQPGVASSFVPPPPSEPINAAPNPADGHAYGFNVKPNDHPKSPKSVRTKAKPRRPGNDKWSHRAGGPEMKKSFASPPHVPDITRAHSLDSFIGASPTMRGRQTAGGSTSPEDMEVSPETQHPRTSNAQPPMQSTNVQPPMQSTNVPPPPPPPPVQLPTPSVNDPPMPIQFSIGAGGKKASKRPSRGRPVYRRSKSASVFPRTSPRKATKIPASSNIPMNPSEESAESSSGQTLQTESTCSSEVDYSGRRALVLSLREEARDAYTKHDYRTAVHKYTMALKVHVGEPPAANESDDLRALLLGNRAAALLMLEAYEAAAHDCQTALRFIAEWDTIPTVIPTDSGPTLRAKLFARLGKALLRVGKLHEAEQAFNNTINTALATVGIANQITTSAETEQTKILLAQLNTDAESGKIEVNRCREAGKSLLDCGKSSASSPTSSRRNTMQALLFVNKALEYAPGSESFHEKKVMLLASLKRWRELAGHCERLAASRTTFDGVFEEDLATLNPIPGVSRAESLNARFFDIQDPVESSTKKLGTRAIGEAVVRLPHTLLPYFFRALRLEERWTHELVAIQALEKYQGHNPNFRWLALEKDKLARSSATKDRGDSLFRSGEYQPAAAQYTSCLTIDGEKLQDTSLGEVSNAGGRLHAILHCNRAACLMAMKKYHEAITDCTSALRIHSHYMKAMLRRSRCYARLERYDEATVEYSRWVELVEKAKSSPHILDLDTTPCLFDSPRDVAAEELAKVKKELEDHLRSKRMAEDAARSEASYTAGGRQHHQDSYARSHSSDAHRRREQFYSQKASSSRRWDSFAGRSPKKDHKTGTNSNGTNRHQQRSQSQDEFFRRSASRGRGRNQQEHRSQSQNGFQGGGARSRSNTRQQRGVNVSPVSNPKTDHYAVLEVAYNASESQIKKAYRRMALKYHPDKNKEAGADEKFRRIKVAYETLNDTESRAKYDATIPWRMRRL